MRTIRVALITTAAGILCAGYAGMAEAQSVETHVLDLRLPSGQVEHIRYSGNVPPTVILGPEVGATSFEPADPFAMLERISAEMDRQAAAFLRDSGALTAPEAAGYGVIPALSGPGVCMRSVQITYAGDGHAPRVVSSSRGDCGPGHEATPHGAATPAKLPNTTVPKHAPNVIQVRAATPYQGVVRTANAW